MEIVYADPRIVVAVKPAGVLSTDEPGGMPQLLRQELGTPCIRTVHRLDAAVSGLMVYARSAKAASLYSDVPVINAGDGGHNHPTQTLTDLLTIHREKGRFDDLTIGLCGDLKFGRTVHSLVAAMSRYTGIRFVLISPEELKLPRYVKEQYIKSRNIPYIQSTSLDEVMPELDILYMTRVQRERFFNEEDYLRLKDSYILTPEKLKNAKPDLRILHPLPRVNEISVAVDEDPRACYFKQVQYGKYIRMALILKLLNIA